jgi:hypothetical protein
MTARATPSEFWEAVRVGLRSLSRASVLWPLLLLGVAELAALAAILRFYTPGLSLFVEPALRTMAGEGATHYPGSFLAAPAVSERLFLFLDIFLGSAMVGAVTLLVAGRASGREVSPAEVLRRVRGSYLRVVGVVAVADLVGATVSTFVYELLSGARGGLTAAPFVARGAGILCGMLVLGLTVYAVAAVVLSGARLVVALWRSISVAAANALMTFILVGIAILPHLPIRYLMSRGEFVITNLKPELLGWLIGADVVLGVFTSVFLVAAVTRLYVFIFGEG